MLNQTIISLENDYHYNNSHNLFKKVKELEGLPRKPLSVVLDKSGVKHFDINEVMECWKEHFDNHLNKEFPHEPGAIETIPEPSNMDIDIPPITINEVEVAVKKLKNRKSPGIDQISGEVLKAGGVKMAEMLLKRR